MCNQVKLTTAYLPPIEYFRTIASAGRIELEQCEFYQKQSYRNRACIYTPLGAESLTIPIVKTHNVKMPIRDVRIDYDYAWIQQHERAIISAYNSSAFFEYYRDDIFSILEKREPFLFDLNLHLLSTLLELVGVKADISFTERYEPAGDNDFREILQPKYKGDALEQMIKKEKTYYQVFSSKHGFIPNLSVIDLLFAEGPNAISFLL